MGNIKVKQYLIQDYVEKNAQILRERILNAAGSVPQSGNKWYLSSSSTGRGDGISSDTPWNSLRALEDNADRIMPGDSVLFERGSVFRGNFITKSGVYYGAYGVGNKPCICGSDRNYADTPWKKAGENIWLLDCKFDADVGLLVFENCQNIGYKRSNIKDLTKNFDFFCDHSDSNKVYLYLEYDPSRFNSLEIGVNKNLIWITENIYDVTIENLSLNYTGAHGIRALNGAKNITVKNCVISYLGGCYIPGYKDGMVRYGNAIEFWQGCENVSIENCWIHDIYDSGISHQGHGSYVVKNITFCNNLIEYCGMGSIEYWLWYRCEDENWAENVRYSDNIMRFAGYGFGGEQRPDKVSAHILSNGNNQNKFLGFCIEGNIFDRSSCELIEISSRENTYPELKANTYIQGRGLKLGTFAESRDVVFDDLAEDIIVNEWGDTFAKVYCI